MRAIAAATILLFVGFDAVACKPAPPPPGVHRRSATPQEAQALAPFAAIGRVSLDPDDQLKARGFRFTVERWIKGSGPEVVYVSGPFYSRHSKLPAHSCMVELPIDTRVVLLLKAVEADGRVVGIHDFEYLNQTNLFVSPVIPPHRLGL